MEIYPDADGVSCFRDVEVAFSPSDVVSGIRPMRRSEFLASECGFLAVPAGWNSGWHNATGDGFAILLQGCVEIEVGSGEVRRLAPGPDVAERRRCWQGPYQPRRRARGFQRLHERSRWSRTHPVMMRAGREDAASFASPSGIGPCPRLGRPRQPASITGVGQDPSCCGRPVLHRSTSCPFTPHRSELPPRIKLRILLCCFAANWLGRSRSAGTLADFGLIRCHHDEKSVITVALVLFLPDRFGHSQTGMQSRHPRGRPLTWGVL